MITAGTYPPDLGTPGMTLQREYQEGDRLIWRDVVKDRQVVKSPVDVDALPFGVYRLKTNQPPLPRPRGFLP